MFVHDTHRIKRNRFARMYMWWQFQDQTLSTRWSEDDTKTSTAE